MLLVGITMLSMGALAALVFAIPGPAQTMHAEFAIHVDAGSGGWGTGDERITVVHQGGEAWATDNARILVAVNGTVSAYEAAALDGGFADGALEMGERWSLATSVQAGQMVAIELVALDQNQLLAQHARVAG